MSIHKHIITTCVLFIMLAKAYSAFALVLNNPYPASDALANNYYSSFNEQPKTLDPARSYSSNEYVFISQIYEPLLEYDYYKRPYELVPLTSKQLPEVRYLDAKGQPITGEAINPAYTVYTLHIQPGILYQPHPAFAKNQQGQYLYHQLDADFLQDQAIGALADFEHSGTREMIADDYIYQIKRLANPAVSSPIYGLMGDYIVGFKEFADALPQTPGHYVDLRQIPLKGVKKLDDYTFEITLKGQYQQFIFWLAMPFFSPVPWEADVFYSQAGMDDKNLSFDWYPVGTGAFMLTQNNPNRSMVLEKNPNYRKVVFPDSSNPKDKQAGYTVNAGKLLPLIDKAVYTLEKESIPRWNKFLQGYYDASGISADSFEKAIHINRQGKAVLSPEMQEKKIYLTQMLEPSIYYMGFNMLDPIVGGFSESARNLRLAISLAVNYDEYIAIFYNGRGIPAQGPVPPGIFGFKEGIAGINPYVYQWTAKGQSRRSLSEAKKRMIKAGYPGGIDPKTGHALILHYDVASGKVDDKSMLDWMRKQFARIGIDLNVRATLYNRFQEKIRTGNAQIFSWGWNADYPDPENFLFQLYGANGKVAFGGENATNYSNPQFDRLFELMKNRSNDAQRQQWIDQMLAIARYDAPWIWGVHPESFLLSQSWVSHIKPNTMSLGSLKYIAIDAELRNQLRTSWNQAVFWPLGLLLLLLLALTLPLVFAYRKKEQQPALRRHY